MAYLEIYQTEQSKAIILFYIPTILNFLYIIYFSRHLMVHQDVHTVLKVRLRPSYVDVFSSSSTYEEILRSIAVIIALKSPL